MFPVIGLMSAEPPALNTSKTKKVVIEFQRTPTLQGVNSEVVVLTATLCTRETELDQASVGRLTLASFCF